MLSELPEGWQRVPLSGLLEVMRNGFSCKQEKSPLEGYVPVSRIETISTGSIDASRVGYLPYEEKLERYKIEKGDILFSHINSVEHIAKIAFAEEAQSFFHAMNLLLMRADSTKIIPFYLAEVLRWERTRSYFREHCKRAVNQVSLNQKNIGGYELPLPPLNEQHRIAEILSSVDASIQATQAVIEQAERAKRGLMEELLTGGLGSEAIERGEVPEGWHKVQLSEVLEVMRNGFSCKQEKSPLEGYVPVSRIETISTGFIDATRVGYVPYEEKLERYKIEKGDILFSHINSIEHIAKIAFSEVAQSFFHAMNLLLLRADCNKVIPFYLAEVLRWERTRSYFREHCKRAVNQVSLNQKNIGGYEFPLPLVEEQKRIAEILSSADAFIAKQKSIVEQQNRIKRGLMDDLLTGKVRTV